MSSKGIRGQAKRAKSPLSKMIKLDISAAISINERTLAPISLETMLSTLACRKLLKDTCVRICFHGANKVLIRVGTEKS